MHPDRFDEQTDDRRIIRAIDAAESRTSGELRVFVSHEEVDDAVAAATRAFEKLGMTATDERNGVLIFIAPRSQKFAIIGDVGVHQHCGEAFWREVAGEMAGYLRGGDYTRAIEHGVARAGELLARHFPRRSGDRNELSNKPVHDRGA